MMAVRQHLASAGQVLLPMGLAACAPSAAELDTCRHLVGRHDREVRDIVEAFKRTPLGKREMAKSLAQRIAERDAYPRLEDGQAMLDFMNGIERVQARYAKLADNCRKQGL